MSHFADRMYTLTSVSAGSIAHAFASQINATNWTAASALIPLQAQASGATLTITADRPGIDGNMLRMYAVAKNDAAENRRTHSGVLRRQVRRDLARHIGLCRLGFAEVFARCG